MASSVPHHSISSSCSTRHPYSFDLQDWSAFHPSEAELGPSHWQSLTNDECAPPSPRTRLALEEFFGLNNTAEAKQKMSEGESQQAQEGKATHSEEAVFAFQGKDNGTDEQQIWRMTNEYLKALNQFCSEQGRSSLSTISSSLVQQCNSEDPSTSRQISFVLQALEIATSQTESSSTPSLPVSQSLIPGLKPRSISRSEEEIQEDNPVGHIHSGNTRLRPIPKAKTGRKPEKFVCFLCRSVFPYKKNLIRHFQADHGIGRCQSLLYKRLRQGEEFFKKLYLETEGQSQ